MTIPKKVISVYSGEDEAKYVVEETKPKSAGQRLLQMAVPSARLFKPGNLKKVCRSYPHQVIGGPKFYERAEIRDALAYFRVVLQPHDDLAFERIINKPARGIGAKTIEKFRDTARSNGISLYMAVEKMVNDGTLTGKAKTNMADLIDKFNQWRQAMQAITPDDLATQILEDSGYIEMLKLDNSVEAPGRLENLKELISVLSDHEKYPTLAEFLEHVSLVMDNDDALDTNKVMLITLHSAKGLEFDIVFLPGWEEGLFPHQRSLDEGGTSALEEERRLAYVAITRAKKQLYILTALNRRVYGQWQNNIPSRFINELPPANIEICNNVNNFYTGSCGGNYGNRYGSSYDSGSSYRPWYAAKRNNAQREEYNDGNRFSYTREPDYHRPAASNIIGTKVYHQTFGYGKVIAAEGNKLEIMFDNYGHKKLHKDYVTKV
ncbi:MAG: ATP-dependent helicase [Alphaproteobacteria bacterium]